MRPIDKHEQAIDQNEVTANNGSPTRVPVPGKVIILIIMALDVNSQVIALGARKQAIGDTPPDTEMKCSAAEFDC